MTITCVLCLERQEKGSPIRFHSLPPEKESIRREKWVTFIQQYKNTWKPLAKRNSLCSQHFTQLDYMTPGKTGMLKAEAIPSIFDKENIRKKKRRATKSPYSTPKKVAPTVSEEQINSPEKKRSRALFTIDSNTPASQCRASGGSRLSFSLAQELPPTPAHQKQVPELVALDTNSTASQCADSDSYQPFSPIGASEIIEAPSFQLSNVDEYLNTGRKKDVWLLYEQKEIIYETYKNNQPLLEKDLLIFIQLRRDMDKLKEKVFKWACTNLKEELIDTLETSAHLSEAVQAEYLVMKAVEKQHAVVIKKREERIEHLENKIEDYHVKLESLNSTVEDIKVEKKADLYCLEQKMQVIIDARDAEVKRLREENVRLTDENHDFKKREEANKKNTAKLVTQDNLIKELNKRIQKHYADLAKANRQSEKVRLKLKKEKLTNKAQRKLLRNMTTKIKRSGKKITTLNEALKALEKKGLIAASYLKAILELPASVQGLIGRVVKKSQGKLSNGEQYDPDTRRFAISLYHYSPICYNYVRNSFRNCLPHRATISSWLATIEAEPGFQGEAFAAIKGRVAKEKENGNQILVSLSLDDMSLKRQVEYDGKGRVWGYVDLGEEDQPVDENTTEATFAACFMIVGLNMRLRMPCGYFLINSLNGHERAELLAECIIILEDMGVRVENVVFDGTSTNCSMVKFLGAQIDQLNLWHPQEIYHTLVTSFPNPADPSRRINVCLDAVHMIKLIRNCLGKRGCIIWDEDGKKIEWRYINALHDHQTEEGLHFANKLSAQHIQFWKKMKVKLAAQTLSQSVANSIEYLDKKRHMEEFKGSEATVKFIRMVDKTFDILNSSSKFGMGNKAPLKPQNIEERRLFCKEAEEYFSSLRVEVLEDKEHPVEEQEPVVPIVPNVNGRNDNQNVPLPPPPALCCSLRRGFVGLVVCMRSALDIYDRLVVEESVLEYLLTYKLSQDHLEMFFGRIRRGNGCNTNPTCRIFMASYKRLVVFNEIKSGENSNVTDQFDYKILTTTRKSKSDSNSDIDVDMQDIRDDLLQDIDSQEEYTTFFVDSSYAIQLMLDHGYASFTSSDLSRSAIAEHLSGYVAFQLKFSTKCEECRDALLGSASDMERYSYSAHISKGFLTVPSPCLVRICKMTENLFRKYNRPNLNYLLAQNIPLKVAMMATEQKIFENSGFKQHILNLQELGNHVIRQCKIVSETYLGVRVFHATKLINEVRGASSRHFICRTVTNNHQ